MTDAPPTKNARIVAIALSVVAAAALIYAAMTRNWLVNSGRHEELGFGLRSSYACESLAADHECVNESNGSLISSMQEEGGHSAELASSAFAPMGWATFVECMLAAFGLLAAAAIAAARKTPALPMSPSTIALLGIMASLITGCVFVATKPGPAGYVGVGQSFWVFGAGIVLGIAGAQMLAKVNRPSDPDLMSDAMNPDEF
jgi:hypothetical protein